MAQDGEGPGEPTVTLVQPGDRPLRQVAIPLDAARLPVRDRLEKAGTPPACAERLWLVPSLVDAHVHVSGMPHPERFLDAGVTCVRDLGGASDVVADWSRSPRAPRVVAYGGALDQSPLPPHMAGRLGAVPIRHFGDVTAHLETLQRCGAAGVKLYQGFPPELVAPTVAAAHRAGLRVAHHAGSGSLPAFARSSAAASVTAGVDSVEHVHSLTADLLPPADRDAFVTESIDSVGAAFGRVFRAWALIDPWGDLAARLVERFATAGTVLVPTLAPFAAMAGGQGTTGIAAVFARQHDLHPEVLAAGLANMAALTRRLHSCGARVALGTDAAVGTGVQPGSGLWQEMGLLLDAGLSGREVLECACPTGSVAERLAVPDAASSRHRLLLRGSSLEDAIRRADPRLVPSGATPRHPVRRDGSSVGDAAP